MNNELWNDYNKNINITKTRYETQILTIEILFSVFGARQTSSYIWKSISAHQMCWKNWFYYVEIIVTISLSLNSIWKSTGATCLQGLYAGLKGDIFTSVFCHDNNDVSLYELIPENSPSVHDFPLLNT